MDRAPLFSPANLGFVRAAVVSPELRVADVAFNTQAIIAALREAAGQGCRLAVFPELCLTGYSCADLFYQRTLLEAAAAALDEIALEAHIVEIAVVVGLPLAVDGRLFNCAAALIADGRVLGFVPKTYLPSTNEFYEERWFTSASLAISETVEINGWEAPFGRDLLFAADNLPGCKIGIEVCEDLWAVNPPSGDMALAGATILLNGSASNELLGKMDYRRDLVRQQSARSPGGLSLRRGRAGRISTTDTVWAGHSLIAENGGLLAETERFRFETMMAVADVDVQRLDPASSGCTIYLRRCVPGRAFRTVRFDLPGEERWSAGEPLIRPQLSRTPFVPADPERRAIHCQDRRRSPPPKPRKPRSTSWACKSRPSARARSPSAPCPPPWPRATRWSWPAACSPSWRSTRPAACWSAPATSCCPPWPATAPCAPTGISRWRK